MLLHYMKVLLVDYISGSDSWQFSSFYPALKGV